MQENYLDILVGDKRYIQRRETSKIIACNKDGKIIKTYMLQEELPSFVQDEIEKINEMRLHPEDYFEYQKNKYGNFKITKFNNKLNAMNIEIPTKIEGNEISALGAIFYMDKTISHLVIGNNIDSVDSCFCYNCSNLEEVYLPSTFTIIPDSAFMDCEKLKKINLENIQLIRSDAFRNCQSLNKIDLKSLNILDDNGFRDCIQIEEIYAPRLETIGFSAFADCTNLKHFIPGNSLSKIKTEAFRGCCSLEEINLPRNVREISPGCFENCTLLSKVSFGDELEFIHSYAFARTNLSGEISFSQNLKMIGENAFEDCEFTRINIYNGTIVKNAFSFNQRLKIRTYSDVTLFFKKLKEEQIEK